MAHRWGYSSVGRALLLHGRCQRFESAYLHNIERILEFENFITFKKSSKQELTMDTLVFRSDEGRGYQRNVSGNWKRVLIRKYPNKETSWTTSWIHREERVNPVNWNILVTGGRWGWRQVSMPLMPRATHVLQWLRQRVASLWELANLVNLT